MKNKEPSFNNNRKSDFSINTLMTELQVVLLEMVSTALIDNDKELLIDFQIDDIVAEQLSDDLLSFGSDYQTLILEKFTTIVYFNIKDGSFSSNQHPISDKRKTFRSTIDIYSNRVNFLLLRLVTMAARQYDENWLNNFGIKFKDAVKISKMDFPDQIQLIRNCSASKGLAIDVRFDSQSFYLARSQIHEQRTINSFIDALLGNKVDISRGSLKDYFGILPNEFSLRKRILGQTSKKGPKYQLTNEDALLIDADWVKDISYFKNIYSDLDDEWRYIPSELMKYYVLHRKYDIPIGSIISHNQNILNNK